MFLIVLKTYLNKVFGLFGGAADICLQFDYFSNYGLLFFLQLRRFHGAQQGFYRTLFRHLFPSEPKSLKKGFTESN